MAYKTAAIVINWNSWSELDICLKAVKHQTVPFDRIVVVDNASNKSGQNIISEWNSQVEFHILAKNEGFAKANNIAFETIKDYDYFALVNPDAYLEKDWLQNMLLAAEHYQNVASFASCLVMANDRGRLDGCGDNYHMSGFVWREWHGRVLDNLLKKEKSVFSACAAAAFYRFDTFEAVGGFDEDYFCYLEDVDLGFRLKLLGYNCVLVPNAIAYHVGSATTGGKHSDFAVYHGHRNLVWTYVKNMPGFLFWVLLPFHLILNLVSIILFVARGQGFVILKAKWDALKGVKAMWHKRKKIQASRVVSEKDIWRELDKRILLRVSDRT